MTAPSLKGSTRVIVVLLPMVSAIPMKGSAQDTTAVNGNLPSTLMNLENHSLLMDALQRSGLAATLAEEGPYTLFAPTNAAVTEFAEDSLASMNSEELTELLRYHLLTDAVSQEEAASLGELLTVHGDTLTAEEADESVRVNDATIVTANIEAANGIIHGIDAVLVPPDESAASDGKSG